MRVLLAIASVMWLWLLPATLAAGVIAVIVAVTGGHWPWYVWLLLSPTLYFVWLVCFLFFCAPMIKRIGRRFPKPRHATVPGAADRGLLTVTACSLRMHLITNLPLVSLLQHAGWGRKLVMEAYAPSTHIGKGVQLAGRVTDPDLTFVGDFVTIGTGTTISAHLWMSPGNGKREYFTAPVKIGQHAMIGGNSAVMPGCTIGEYAVLQPWSYVVPHTEIPAGEIWGGNPAAFQRKRARTPKDRAGAAGDAS